MGLPHVSSLSPGRSGSQVCCTTCLAFLSGFSPLPNSPQRLEPEESVSISVVLGAVTVTVETRDRRDRKGTRECEEGRGEEPVG